MPWLEAPDRDTLVSLAIDHVRKTYPRLCSCGQVFETVEAYLRGTIQVGSPRSYDLELGLFLPVKPIGGLSHSNCLECGTTLSVGSEGMKLSTVWALMAWARHQKRTRGVSFGEALGELRHEVDVRLIGEEDTARRERQLPPR